MSKRQRGEGALAPPYIEDFGDELVCPECFALVPNDYTDQHERWHKRIGDLLDWKQKTQDEAPAR